MTIIPAREKFIRRQIERARELAVARSTIRPRLRGLKIGLGARNSNSSSLPSARRQASRSRTSTTRSRHDDRVSGLSELDAIEPNPLRAIVQETIELHLPAEQYEVLKAAEESERDIITRLVGKIAQKRLR